MSEKLEYSPEKNIAGQANALPIRVSQQLGQFAQKRICKIKISNGEATGTGFFCTVNIDEWDYSLKIRVLTTNYHVLPENDIKQGKKIIFSKNDDEQKYEIMIDEKRKIYTSEKYDITMVELKREDNIEPDSFFEIDDNIKNQDYNWKNKDIYLLHYPKGKEMNFSLGKIKNIVVDDNLSEIQHLCDSDHGSSGGPLINSENYRVIGIHKGGAKKYNFNCGTLLKEPIIEFTNQIKNKNNNNNKIKENKNKEINIIEEKKEEEKKEEEKKEEEKKEEEKKIEKKEKNIKKEPYNVFIENKDKEKEKDNNNLNKLTDKNDEEDDLDEITIQYKVEEIEDKDTIDIRIFGEDFVLNNKKICIIVINGKQIVLTTSINAKRKQINNGIFEIKLRGLKYVTDMSGMFAGCRSLISLPDISKLNTEKITNMRGMFYECRSLSSLPDISNWNTQNVTDMSFMFSECKSLSSLPDISNWNTQNVTDMSFMFSECKSLSSLPDIKKWNTKKVTYKKDMFKGCKAKNCLIY